MHKEDNLNHTNRSQALGLSTNGLKADLVERLREHLDRVRSESPFSYISRSLQLTMTKIAKKVMLPRE